MLRFLEKQRQWILPALLIMIILVSFTMPFVLGLTYAGRSEVPNHVLVYGANYWGASLTWDTATGVDPDTGVAELDLFNAIYDETVIAADGEKVVAPGTDGYNIVQLNNTARGAITYTAVLYRIRSDDRIPVGAGLTVENATDTDSYRLPDHVDPTQVIRAVKGSLGGGQIKDFDVNWFWNYDDGASQDRIDTKLGDIAAFEEPGKVTVGLYIVVEDGNAYLPPYVPMTGDDSMIGMFYALMGISAVLLILLFFSRRREKKCES